MLPKVRIAASKIVVNNRPDVTAGSLQNLTTPLSVTQQVADILAGRRRYTSGSISVGTEINQQRQEKREERYCEIQGSQEGIHSVCVCVCVLLYTSPCARERMRARVPASACV
mgnify:CR=1 FL=1